MLIRINDTRLYHEASWFPSLHLGRSVELVTSEVQIFTMSKYAIINGLLYCFFVCFLIPGWKELHATRVQHKGKQNSRTEGELQQVVKLSKKQITKR